MKNIFLVTLLLLFSCLSLHAECDRIELDMASYREATTESVIWPATQYPAVNMTLIKGSSSMDANYYVGKNDGTKMFVEQSLIFSSIAGTSITKVRVQCYSIDYAGKFAKFSCLNGTITNLNDGFCEITPTDGTSDVKVTATAVALMTSAEIFYQEQYHERVASPGVFGSICLPYNSTVEGAECYRITEKVMDNGELKALVLEAVDGIIPAGPCIFKNTKEKSIWRYSGKRTNDETITSNGLVGNIGKDVVNVPSGCYGISQGKIRKVTTGKGTIAPYRAYIDLTDVQNYSPSSARHDVVWGVDGSVETDVQEVKAGDAGERKEKVIYDLGGKKYNKVQRGINIVDGKLIIK